MKGFSWWREPLVHFLAIGALLFLLFNWRGGGGRPRTASSSHRDRSTRWSPVHPHLAATANRSGAERAPRRLRARGDGHARGDGAGARPRRHGDPAPLAQKLEFVAEDTIDAAPATEAELQAWLDAHPDAFRTEAQVAFRQVYLSPDRRGAAVDADARALLARLSAAGPSAATDHVGDALMLPGDVSRSSRHRRRAAVRRRVRRRPS